MSKIRILFCLFSVLIISNLTMKADWETFEGGPAGPINSLFVSSDGKIFAGSLSLGVFISINNGESWIDRNTTGLSAINVRSVIYNSGKVIAGTEGSGIFVSTNDGDSWKKSNDGLGNMFIYSMSIDNNKIYAGTDESGIFRTDDNGVTWKSLNDGSINYPVITVNATNNKVFLGTTFGGLLESTNNGTTWMNINPNVIKLDILSIAVKDNKYFVGTKDGGIFFSTDDGKNWTSISTGLKNTYITSIVIKDSKIIVGTKGGVFYSENDGKAWIDVSGAIPDKEVWSLAYDATYVYAGTGSASIARRKLSEFVMPDVQPPVQTSPSNDAINLDTEVNTTWNSSNGAVSYHVQIAKDPDFNNISVQKDGITNTFYKSPTLEKNVKYFWRVAANTPDNQKKWSAVWNFTTKAEQEKPTLLEPADKDPGVAMPVVFKWNKKGGTASYFILVCEDDKFDTLTVVNQSNIQDTTFTAYNLKENVTYYWKLATVGYDDVRKWSDEIRSFKTKPTSVPSIAEDGISSISCYPNPASDFALIKFRSSSSSNVRIKIYSTLGLFSESIFEGRLQSNENLINLQTTGFNSGSYIVVMESEGKTLSVPLNIIK